MKVPNLTYYNYLLITAPKIDTDLLWDLSFLFAGIGLVYFAAVFFYRNKISAASEKVKQRKRELSPMISEFLFLEEDATKDEKTNYVSLKIEIRQLLKTDFNRKVLSEILLDLRKDVAGEAQKSLFDLYQDLGLDKDAFAKLKSWRWQVVSKGILELTQMQVSESYSFITKFINDRRATIRKQAEIATVTLKQEGINYFLDTTKYKISEWQQLKLLDVIRNKEDFQPPRFKAWLTSSNRHVVLFALRLIKYYNQNDTNSSLIELVKHKNNQIKQEAVACIKEFNVTEALDTLKLVFWDCTADVKIAILDAIAQIGTQTDIEFLNLIDKKESNFSVKSKALSSINAISPESIMPSMGIKDSSRYKVPEDITEAVAKVHAQKHQELSGDHEEDFEEDENTEPETPTPEILLEDTIETPAVTQEKEVHEVDMVTEEAPEDSTEDYQEEAFRGLNFLPIVIDEVEEEESESIVPFQHQLEKDATAIDLFDIEVVFEDLVITDEEEEVGTTEENHEQVVSPFYAEFDMAKLAFLPIVIDEEPEEQEIQDMELKEEAAIDLLEMKVVYEEITPEIHNKEESDEIAHELQTEDTLDFSKYAAAVKNHGYERYQTPEVLNAAVTYEDISAKETVQETSDIEVIDPFFFPVSCSLEELPGVTFKNLSNDEIQHYDLPIQDDELLLQVINDLIAFDDAPDIEQFQKEIEPWRSLGWELDEGEIEFLPELSDNEEEKQSADSNTTTKANTSEDLGVEIPKASIPRAIFGDIEFEASTRQLLNDLEELGDYREVLFLRELLAHEKYDPFNERINNLIEKFNVDAPRESIGDTLKPFSVFEDLFRTCDTESKLILLDEVVVVGDEKDLDFLVELLSDDELEIQLKAFKVLAKLQERLSTTENPITDGNNAHTAEKVFEEAPKDLVDLMDELKIRPADNSDIFELNFDFPEENKKSKKEAPLENQKAAQYGSFFGQLCSFSHKIIEKLNG